MRNNGTCDCRYSQDASVSRRAFLARTGMGVGTLALAHLLQSEGMLRRANASEEVTHRSETDLSPRGGHFPARAKAMIILFQSGGPSQMDLFDPKAELQSRNGLTVQDSFEVLQPGNSNILMGSPFRFSKHGQAGMDFSELVPHLASRADDICMVRSMCTDNNNHPQAVRIFNTGKLISGRPTLGSWVCYALGTENQNLPAYVALRDPKGYNSSGTLKWDCGFLPAVYKGTEFRSQGAPVLDLHPAFAQPEGAQRNDLDLLNKLNEEHRRRNTLESDLEARIKHYELAARMQLSAEKVVDVSSETQATRQLYGLDQPATADYGLRCLMARRLIEAGVRFVHVSTPVSTPWDNHSNLKAGITEICGKIDRPSAALIADLKQRGLLDSTIVVWAGEFGRLPITQNGNGRDHNRLGFTSILAGGGFKPGYLHGKTDELGYKAVEGKVSCPDLLATILHQFGINHELLAYHHNGRDETLTDPAVTGAHVAGELLTNSVMV